MHIPRFPRFASLSFGFALAVVAAGCAGPANEPTAQRFSGRYTHMLDTGSFVDCRSGERLVVATEGDNRALEAAYLKAQAAPGVPVLAIVDGRVESRVFMEGPKRPMLIVERFVEVRPGYNCSGPIAPVSLENTYWKLLSLKGSSAVVADRQAEPHLILRSNGQLGGSGGCNRLRGSYAVDGERLTMSGLAATMMACPQGMAQERAMLEMLGEVARWRIFGDHLQLLGSDGDWPLAQLEARALR